MSRYRLRRQRLRRHRPLQAEQLEDRRPLAVDFGFALTLGSSGPELTNSVVTDAAGNVYITGELRNTIDFDPGPGTFILSGGTLDAFIAKYSPAGALLWAQNYGGTGIDWGIDLAIDPNGNLWATGRFAGSVDFDTGPGTAILDDVGSGGVYLLKLDSDGQFLWAGSIDGANGEGVTSLSIDANGNVFVAGQFNGQTDFDPSAGTAILTSQSTFDAYLAKYSNTGQLLWAKGYGGSAPSFNGDKALDVATDAAGYAYVTGTFLGSADLDPGPGVFSVDAGGLSRSNIYVSKFDPAGNFVWGRMFLGSSSDQANGIAVDAAGNVITAGFFQSTVDFDPGPANASLTAGMGNIAGFICKLDTNGNFVWVAGTGTSASTENYDLSLAGNGDVFFTGQFSGTNDFDPGPGTFNLTSAGSVDAFVARLNSSGQFVSALRFGGSVADRGRAIALNRTNGNVFIGGQFNGTVDFDPGAATFSRTSVGGDDAFLSKLIFSDPPIAAGDSYSTLEDVILSIAAPGVLANDSGGGLSAVLETRPFFGTVTLEPNGGFTYIAAPNYSGPDSFSYRTSNAIASSTIVTVALQVTPVNDPPTFTAGADQNVRDDSGPQSFANWATAISVGPANESAQTRSFLVTNDNSGLFTAQPEIDPTGRLTFTPARNARGVATVTVKLRDNGGIADTSIDTSPNRTFRITITKPQPWHNSSVFPSPAAAALDVNADKSISPIDAVLVINYLNAGLPAAVSLDAPVGGPKGTGAGLTAFLDTGGGDALGTPDNFISAIDAVLVINYLNSAQPASATFVRADSTTQGNWLSVYGAAGYAINSGPTNLPPSASISFTGGLTDYYDYVFAQPTTDPRALQHPSGTGRVATAWTGDHGFTLDLNLTDRQTHHVALYMLDWNTTSRWQRLEVFDAESGQLLDSQEVDSFNMGKYLVWNISGHVRIRFTNLANGLNTVLSGIFIGT